MMPRISGWIKVMDMNDGDESTLWDFGAGATVEIKKVGKYYEVNTPDGVFTSGVNKKIAYQDAIGYMREFNKQGRW
jgi:hypothetical protein